MGEFPWATVEEAMAEIPGSFNLVNPLPKGETLVYKSIRLDSNKEADTFYTPAAAATPSWMVVRYQGEFSSCLN